jgi:hypothetical protein
VKNNYLFIILISLRIIVISFLENYIYVKLVGAKLKNLPYRHVSNYRLKVKATLCVSLTFLSIASLLQAFISYHHHTKS